MTFTLHNTDAISCAALVPDNSVHAIITSSPYYALRRYAGVPDLVWDGDPVCKHEWGDEGKSTQRLRNGQGGTLTGGLDVPTDLHPSQGSTCALCNAWRGQLGAEPTPAAYVDHLVAVFRAWRPKLHKSGIAVINLGDSYAGGGGFSPGSPSNQPNAMKARKAPTAAVEGALIKGKRAPDGIAPKNLLLIPFRFALAMQADGWILRNECPWVKTNAMPQSVTDRLTVGHEWFLLFSREGRYFWDAGAVRRANAPGSIEHREAYPQDRYIGTGKDWQSQQTGGPSAMQCNPAGRNLRTSDVWLDGLDATIAHVAGYLDHLREIRDGGGLLTDPDGETLALYASTKGTDAEHYAAYGAHLVVPWVRAGVAAKCCSVCGAPWQRVTETERPAYHRDNPKDSAGNDAGASNINGGRGAKSSTLHRPGWQSEPERETRTLGWSPTCPHTDAPTVPGTVADPFSGTATTAVVAIQEGRHFIGCEPSTKYYPDAVKRLESVAAQPALFDAAGHAAKPKARQESLFGDGHV